MGVLRRVVATTVASKAKATGGKSAPGGGNIWGEGWGASVKFGATGLLPFQAAGGKKTR